MSRKSPRDPNFPGMPPTARLHRPWIITEKINGTNGLIAISNDLATAESIGWPMPLANYTVLDESNDLGWQRIGVWAGSKNQWLGPDGDNFGFGGWVKENAVLLADLLGPGLHRGEWWGSGIQTGYDLPKGEKRFSFFNTSRWDDRSLLLDLDIGLDVVPKIHDNVDGHDLNEAVIASLALLEQFGSLASPGFMRAEGIVAFQPASQTSFKATIHNDEIPKGQVR